MEVQTLCYHNGLCTRNKVQQFTSCVCGLLCPSPGRDHSNHTTHQNHKSTKKRLHRRPCAWCIQALRICSKICAFPETHFDARVGAREGFVWVRGVRQDPSTGLLRPVTCICKNLSNFASRWTRQESRSSVLNAKRFPRTYGVSRRQQARGFSDSDGDCPSLRVGGGGGAKDKVQEH